MAFTPAAQAAMDQGMADASQHLDVWVETTRRCQAVQGAEQGFANAWALLVHETTPAEREGLLVAALRRLAEREVA